MSAKNRVYYQPQGLDNTRKIMLQLLEALREDAKTQGRDLETSVGGGFIIEGGEAIFAYRVPTPGQADAFADSVLNAVAPLLFTVVFRRPPEKDDDVLVDALGEFLYSAFNTWAQIATGEFLTALLGDETLDELMRHAPRVD